MNRDEFNSINITNDRQVSGREFGNFQRDEYVFKSENAINKEELNSTSGSDMNDISVVNEKEKDDIDKKLSRKDREMIEKAVESESGSAAATSSGASANAASASASSSAAGASAAASSVASAAVVVSAFAVAVAAPIILSKAKVVNDPLISVVENSIVYEMELTDTTDEGKYYAILSSDSYNESQELFGGPNRGSFLDLSYDETYKFVVEEGGPTEVKRVLYETEITVANKLISEFRGISVSEEVDYLNKELTVTLDYVDENNYYSDFALIIEPYSEVGVSNSRVRANEAQTSSFVVPLEKTTEPQVVNFEDLDLDLRYVYLVEYNDSSTGQKVTSSKSEPSRFNDVSGAKSEFESVLVSHNVNFLNKTMEVTLSYTDDFNIFGNFQLFLQDVEENEVAFDLEKTTLSQTIKFEEMSLDTTYTYYVKYYDGKTMEYVSTDISQPISFVDTSGAKSEITSAVLSQSADYVNKTINVTLSFVDDFNYFSDFQVVLQDLEGGYFVFPLVKTTEPQSASMDASLSNDNELYFDQMEFTYEITYMDSRSEELVPQVFDSVESFYFTENTYVGESTFNGINFTYADYSTHELFLTLDYVDSETNPEIDDYIYLTIIDNDFAEGENNTLDRTLTKTTGEQSISLKDEEISRVMDLEKHNITYELSYYQNQCSYLLTGSINVADVDGRFSGINNFSFESAGEGKAYADGEVQLFKTSFVYYDFFGSNLWSEFRLNISTPVDENNPTTGETQPEKLSQYYIYDNNLQQDFTFYYGDGYNEGGDYIDLLLYESLDWSLTYTDNGGIVHTYSSGTISFVDKTLPAINAVDNGLVIEQADPTGTSESYIYYLPIKFDFTDDSNKLERGTLDVAITNASLGADTKATLELISYSDEASTITGRWQLANISMDNASDFIGNQGNELVVTWYYGNDTIELYRGSINLEAQNESTPLTIYGMDMSDGVTIATSDGSISYQLGINSLIYNGSFGSGQLQLVLTKHGEENYYSFEISEIPEIDNSVTVDVGNSLQFDGITGYDVYLRHISNGETVENVLCYENLILNGSSSQG